MPAYPPEPESAESILGDETTSFRYDQVSQDGRVRLDAIWSAVGRLLWGGHRLGRSLMALGSGGIRSVLSRVVLEAHDERVTPRAPVHSELRHRFEHTVDEQGDVDRVMFTTWLRTETKDAERRLIGRGYGQRVFTRLDGPPAERRVRRLPDVVGLAAVPEHRAEWVTVDDVLTIPDDAESLDPVPRLDPARVVFGLSHTDLNQHVNFLAYPRFFEQAALARFVDLGVGARLMARRVDVVYRRPAFAGDTLRMAVRAFRQRDEFGIVAAFVDDTPGPPERPNFADFGKPRCVATLVLRP
jgi:hypothetical protein